MKPAEETRAEDVRIGDVWHMERYTPATPSDGACLAEEEFAVIDVERTLTDGGPLVWITLDNGIPNPMTFNVRTWVRVHRGQS